MSEDLDIRVHNRHGHAIVTVAGEIDIATAPQLRAQLYAVTASGRPVIVDLTAVTFLGAAGLGVLATAAARATAHGGKLHVAARRYQIRRLFLLTGLHHQIPVSDTVAEALTTARRAGQHGTAAPAI
jgi:anti-sigma B factor antagonist